jgi:CPA2 family monovalent cation:H+ antiporter-2
MSVTHLLAELTVLGGVSGAVAFLGQRYLGVVPLVAFLLTGVAIGPHALGLVADVELVEGAAEIGVVLLLFTIGIEFSLERLARIRRLILGGGTLQVLLTLGASAAILAAFGVPWSAAAYTGCLVALSSTVIALKLLADSGTTSSEQGKAALAVLIFQDMAVVGMVLLLPVLAGRGGGTIGVLIALGKALGIIALVLVLARRAMPRLLELIAHACSPEIFLLSLVAICFGTAWIASVAGLGVSLGAFLAGLIVSESKFSEHALSEILPLRILFSVAFFVSIGMLLDPTFVLREPVLVAGIVVGVLLLKAALTTTSLLVLRLPLATSLGAGFLLAQIGEFSFVLERQGTALGLFPAGSEELGGQAFIAATVVLMVATPFISRLGSHVANGVTRREAATAGPETTEVVDGEFAAQGHVLLCGYGPYAQRLTGALQAGGVDLVIVTLSPEGADRAEDEGHAVLRGDYTRRPLLEHAGLRWARMLVVADDDLARTERVVAVARSLRPDLTVIARVSQSAQEATLRDAGAASVVVTEGAGERELVRTVLEEVGMAPHLISLLVAGEEPGGEGVTLTPEQKASPRCSHTSTITTVFPGSDRVCPVCVASGGQWVHLRLCMTCGFVGCCDSSPGRHARQHFEETGHPVVRSWEPGEDWAWCFVDQANL